MRLVDVVAASVGEVGANRGTEREALSRRFVGESAGPEGWSLPASMQKPKDFDWVMGSASVGFASAGAAKRGTDREALSRLLVGESGCLAPPGPGDA
mmetsp:Transcript_62201/g.145782  ORF Transcript_62201/g.145782 Transcript_62201/m.145782 type:complete len:97 (+) Transcript_62201:499-789(+)